MEDLKKLAQENRRGFPFSARITEKSTGRFVVAVNEVVAKKDPTAHAEIEVIRKAGEKEFIFKDCIITCSGEPCPMCACAIAWAGIKEVYYLDSYKVANEKGYSFDQDVHRVNNLLNLRLNIHQLEKTKT
jgi:guanine deaminase